MNKSFKLNDGVAGVSPGKEVRQAFRDSNKAIMDARDILQRQPIMWIGVENALLEFACKDNYKEEI